MTWSWENDTDGYMLRTVGLVEPAPDGGIQVVSDGGTGGGGGGGYVGGPRRGGGGGGGSYATRGANYGSPSRARATDIRAMRDPDRYGYYGNAGAQKQFYRIGLISWRI